MTDFAEITRLATVASSLRDTMETARIDGHTPLAKWAEIEKTARKATRKYARAAENPSAWLAMAKRCEALKNALTLLVDEKCDYMKINLLGDPETQHTIKLARAALKGGE